MISGFLETRKRANSASLGSSWDANSRNTPKAADLSSFMESLKAAAPAAASVLMTMPSSFACAVRAFISSADSWSSGSSSDPALPNTFLGKGGLFAGITYATNRVVE